MDATRRAFLPMILFRSAVFVPCSAQPWESLGRVTATRRLPNGIELTAGKAKIAVTAVNDSVVRVRVAPTGTFPKDTSWAVLPDGLSATPAVQISDNADAAEVGLRSGRVRIAKNPLRLSFLVSNSTV